MMDERPAGTRRSWFGYVMAGLVLGSLGIGCSMFEIRSPTPPTTGGGPPRANPVDPESVLVNVYQAIRYQEDGLALFDESLSEGFHLKLDVSDVIEMGIPGLDSLSKAQTNDAQRLRSQESPVDSFYFAFGQVEPERTDLTAFYEDTPYTLQVLVQEGDSLAVDLTILGKSDLSLAELTTGKWVMTRWVDKRQNPFPSLGRWYAEKVGQTP